MDKNQAENRAKFIAGIVASGILGVILWATRSSHPDRRSATHDPTRPTSIRCAQVSARSVSRIVGKDLVENTAAVVQVFGEPAFGWPMVIGDDGTRIDCIPQGKSLLRIPRGYDRPPRNPRICFRYGNRTVVSQSIVLPAGKKMMQGIPAADSRIACELNTDPDMPGLRFRLKGDRSDLHCQVRVLNSTWYRPSAYEVFSFENPRMGNDTFAFFPNARCARALRADVVTYIPETKTYPFKATVELRSEGGVTYFHIAQAQSITLPGGHKFTLPKQGNKTPIVRASRRARLTSSRVQPGVFGPFGGVDPNMEIKLISPRPESLGVDQISIDSDTVRAKFPQTGAIKTGPVEILLSITVKTPKTVDHFVVDLPVERPTVARR